MNRFTNKYHTSLQHPTKKQIDILRKERQMTEQEMKIITIVYNSWLDAIVEYKDNELIAHHAKRLKYMVDWLCAEKEMQEKAEANKAIDIIC